MTLLVGALVAVVIAGCGSVQRPAERPSPAVSGAATVRGHVSWPDCSGRGSGCPPLEGVPVNFADLAANRTFTATSDATGAYAVQLPAGTYTVIAGHADRSQYQRRMTVQGGETITLDLPISPPTG